MAFILILLRDEGVVPKTEWIRVLILVALGFTTLALVIEAAGGLARLLARRRSSRSP